MYEKQTLQSEEILGSIYKSDLLKSRDNILGACQVAPVVKNPLANAEDTRDPGSTPGSKNPLEEEVSTTPIFLPENSMDRGAWWATVHGVAKSWTQLRAHTYNTRIVTG